MQPHVILVMRHAEKPDDPANPNLSAAGEIRALALGKYIPETFGAIASIFAAATTKHSARPLETVKPLSDEIGVSIDSSIADNDYSLLANVLESQSKFANRQILICWHHENIPHLMHALGAPGGSFPNPWNPAVFNLVLKITYSGAVASVEQITEPF